MDRDDQAHELAATARSVKMVAGAALIVALTGPLWVPSILGSLNFRSSAEIAAERNRADIIQLEKGSTATETRLKAAEATVAKLREDMGALEKRLASMRDALAAGAAADLAAALRGEDGFVAELAALRAVAAPPPDLAALLAAVAPFAETGLPPAYEVRQRFHHGMAMTMASSSDSPIAWLRRVVMMSPTPTPADPLNPNLIEAEALMRDADLLGAMAALRRIEAPRPDWVDAWLADASARAAADTLAPRLDRWGATPR